MKFIGRTDEKNILKTLFQSNLFESVLLYGRRRVGKSELIKQCIRETDVHALYYECKQTSEMNNVESLSRLISENENLPLLSFSGIEEILEYILKTSNNVNKVLVLDEYSYLRDKVDGMDSILQALIDKYKDVSKLKLIICGSYVDIMQSLIYSHNPLYGRFSKIIDLKQMDYFDSAKFYTDFSHEDKVRLYSVFGGIPYYNRLIDVNKTVRENIIDLIASPGARLELEVSMYLKSEISKIVNANEAFEAMAAGNSKYSDIYSKSHVSSRPTLIDVLEKLIRMEIVVKESPINDERNKKKSGYYINDNLSYFYYKYIFRYLSQMNVMNSDVFYEKFIEEDFETKYVPMMFEKVCKQYLIRLNRKGMLNTPFYKIGKFYYDDPVNRKNGEFDIVSEDEFGYIFYECKYKNAKVTKQMVEQEIQQVKQTNLNCYKFGFFSKSGFEEDVNKTMFLYDLDDIFQDQLE